MAKKKKSKLKRFLKKAAPLLAAGLGAAALSKRGRNLGVSGADKGLFTSDAAYMDNTMPGNLSRNMGMKRRRRDSILANPNINRMDLSEVDLDYTAPNTADYGEEAIYKEEIIDDDVVNVTPDNLSEVNSGDIPGHGPSPAGTGTNLTSFEITDIWSSTP